MALIFCVNSCVVLFDGPDTGQILLFSDSCGKLAVNFDLRDCFKGRIDKNDFDYFRQTHSFPKRKSIESMTSQSI